MLEYPEVLGDRGLADPERRRQLADRMRRPPQVIEQLPPGAVADGVQG